MKAPIECCGLGRALSCGEAQGARLGALCLPLPCWFPGWRAPTPQSSFFPGEQHPAASWGRSHRSHPSQDHHAPTVGPTEGQAAQPHPLPHTGGSQSWDKGTGEQLQGARGGCGAPGMPSLQGSVQVLLEPVVRASKHPCDPSSTGKAAPTPAPSPDLSAEVSPQAWQENKEGNMSTITEITIALMHYQAQ